MSLELIMVLVNLGLLLIGELIILYTIDYKTNVLIVLLATAGVTIYCAYLGINQMEGSMIKLLLIILSGVFWLAAFIQMSPLAFTVTKRMHENLPKEMVIRVSRELLKERNYTQLASERDYTAFKFGKTKVEVDAFSLFKFKFIELSVSPLGGFSYRLFLALAIISYIPVAISLYFETTALYQLVIYDTPIVLYTPYFIVIFIVVMWRLSRHIRSSLRQQLGIIWSDLLTRLEKLKEALRVMEGIRRAKRYLEELKRKKIEEAAEIARSIALAKSIVEQKRQIIENIKKAQEEKRRKEEEERKKKAEQAKSKKKSKKKRKSTKSKTARKESKGKE